MFYSFIRIEIRSDYKNGNIIGKDCYLKTFKYLITYVSTVTIDINNPQQLLDLASSIEYHTNITAPLHLAKEIFIKLSFNFLVLVLFKVF